MNQTVVDAIVKQLNRVTEIPEVKRIITDKQIGYGNLKNFNADYLNEEFRKITSARENDYPTYRSEYRVIKTLIRLRNEIIYELNKQSPMFFVNNDSVSLIFVDLSKYLFDTLESIGNIFEQEKIISKFAEEFDCTWNA